MRKLIYLSAILLGILPIFKLNTELYPNKAWNTYDSYADILLKLKKRKILSSITKKIFKIKSGQRKCEKHLKKLEVKTFYNQLIFKQELKFPNKNNIKLNLIVLKTCITLKKSIFLHPL